MKGQKYSRSRNVLKDAGKGSILVQHLEGSLLLKRFKKKSEVNVFELLPTGKLGSELNLEETKNGIKINFLKAKSQVFKVTVK